MSFHAARQQQKNLVIGFSTNQPELSVRVFCESLRRVYGPDECDVIIVTNRFEAYFRDLASKGVRFESTPNTYSSAITARSKALNRLCLHSLRFARKLGLAQLAPEIAEAYPTLLETWHHPHFARWFSYKRILDVDRSYNKVFFSDVRDVAFQARFFEDVSSDEICFFEDANFFGKCHWNDMWYKQAYGETAWRGVVGKAAVCMGTVLGGLEPALAFLDEFIAYIEREPFGRVDQAMFNHMLLTNTFQTPYKKVPNFIEAVGAIGNQDWKDATTVIDGLVCRKKDRSIIPIIHLYDRWPDMNEVCTAPYSRAPVAA